MNIIITLSSEEIVALTAELMGQDPLTHAPIVPDLTTALPDLVRHMVIQPAQVRQAAYRQAARIQQLLAAPDDVLAAIDSTFAASLQIAPVSKPPILTPTL